MIVRSIAVYVKEGYIEDFIKISRENHEMSIQEPGILRFDLLRSSSDKTRFMLYEVYKTEEAVDAHKETAHYNKWKETVAPMMAKPRERISYDVIAPTDPSMWLS